MMYFGSAGGLGWIWMAFSMIAFWAVVITLVLWAMRSFSQDAAIKPPLSGPMNILQERFARGDISNEEYAQQSQLIQGAG